MVLAVYGAFREIGKPFLKFCIYKKHKTEKRKNVYTKFMLDDERLFPIVQEAVEYKMKRQIAKAEVKNIRVHDDRVIIGASQKKPSKIKGLHMILSYYFLQ